MSETHSIESASDRSNEIYEGALFTYVDSHDVESVADIDIESYNEWAKSFDLTLASINESTYEKMLNSINTDAVDRSQSIESFKRVQFEQADGFDLSDYDVIVASDQTIKKIDSSTIPSDSDAFDLICRLDQEYSEETVAAFIESADALFRQFPDSVADMLVESGFRIVAPDSVDRIKTVGPAGVHRLYDDFGTDDQVKLLEKMPSTYDPVVSFPDRAFYRDMILSGEWVELAKWFSGSYQFHKGMMIQHSRREALDRQADELDRNCHHQITDAFKQQVWPDDIEKNPTWQSDDDVTKQTQEWVDSVLNLEDPLWDEYANIPALQALTVKKHVRESLTQSQGWSLQSVVDRLEDEFYRMNDGQIRTIARTETAAALNRAQIVSLLALPDEPTVRWVGPEDGDQTEMCSDLADATEHGVPLSDFLDRAEEFARSYPEGKTDRIDEGILHYQERYTVELVEE